MSTAPSATPANASNAYDIIVIGSGIGGLATASILAQVGKRRVLVVERHFKLGGFTHSFRRKDYEWDVGVHYVGEMQPGAMTRRIMDLVTRKGVDWHRIGSPFERFVFPEGTFEVPDDPKLYMQKLIERFPAEEANIRIYFKDLKKAQAWVARWFVGKQLPKWLASLSTFFGKKLVSQTTGAYLSRFKDPLLKAILPAQWPDFGSRPGESAFGFHAAVAADFLNGGFFPIGGSKELANHAAAAITDNGGQCLINHEVLRINVINGKASGITALHKGQEVEFTAPVIISNTGAVTTFNKLVPEEYCKAEREVTRRLKRGTSSLVLFVGLKDDPRNHGFDDANYWLYNQLNHDRKPGYLEEEPDRIDGGFVSFCSLKRPDVTAHTAQVISFSTEHEWQKFGGKWKKRGEDYESRKEEVTENMLAFAERHMPGFRSMIDYVELSTPLTVKTFTGHEAGMIYGQACNPDRLWNDSWRVGTSLKNLYLTGSDVGTPGVNGALMAGVMTAAKVLGPLGLPRIFTKAFSI